jgi:hypothetical protein
MLGTAFLPPPPSLPAAVRYMKPLAPAGGAQSLALAILNRDTGPVPGAFVDLTSFSFAPSAGVVVRDVWANTTLGPVFGNFTTRPLAGHETLLLRLTLTVTWGAPASGRRGEL